MARPVGYFSCAKCGYRGICKPEDHECVRTQRFDAAVRPGDVMPSRTVAEKASSGDDDDARKTALDRFVRETSRLIGRHIEIARDRSWGLAVTQRCQVCREEITKAIPWPGIDKLQLELAKAIRHPYLMHRCKPVEQSLFSMTYEELGELWQSVERDATRIAERAVEIEALLNKRRGSAS